MAHAAEKPPTGPIIDDPSASGTYYVTIVGTILFLVITVFAIALFNNRQIIEDQTKLYAIPKPRELAELQSKQMARIAEPRWVDEKAGAVAVPIDDAIPLFLKRMKAEAATRPATIPAATRPAPADGKDADLKKP